MSEVTLRNYLSNGSLWGEIKSIEDFPFIGNEPTELDFMQKIEYGDRILFQPFNDVTTPEIAKVIVKLFSEKWNLLILAESDKNKINIFSNGDKSTVTENANNTTNQETGEVLNKVSSFNDDTLLTDTGINSTNGLSKDYTGNETKTESLLNYNNLFNNLNSIEKSNIINIVLLDVSKYLTIQTY